MNLKRQQPNISQRPTINSELESLKKTANKNQKQTNKKPLANNKQLPTSSKEDAVRMTAKTIKNPPNSLVKSVVESKDAKNITSNSVRIKKSSTIAIAKKPTSLSLKKATSSTQPVSFQPIKKEISRTYTKKELELALENRKSEINDSNLSLEDKNNLEATVETKKDAEEYSSDFESSYGSDFEGYDESFSDFSDEDEENVKKNLTTATTDESAKEIFNTLQPADEQNQHLQVKKVMSIPRSTMVSARSRRQKDYFDLMPYVQVPSTDLSSIKDQNKPIAVDPIKSVDKEQSQSDQTISTLDGKFVATSESKAKPTEFGDFSKSLPKQERTSKLLQMVQLQHVELSLYQQASIEYSQFMRLYGKSNQKQACVQVNEKQNRFVQTESNYQEKMEQKTQAPSLESDQIKLSTESLYDLHHFLLIAEQMLNSLLSPVSSASSSPELNDLQIEFNIYEAKVVASNKKEFMKHMMLTQVHSVGDFVITVHEFTKKEQMSENSAKCFIYLWSVDDRNHQHPLRLLRSWTSFECLLYLTSSSLLLAATDSRQLELFDLKSNFDLNSTLKNMPKDNQMLAESAALSTCLNDENGHLDRIVKLSTSADTWSSEPQEQAFLFYSVDASGRMLNWKIRLVDEERMTEKRDHDEDDDQLFVIANPSCRIRLQLLQTIDLNEYLPTMTLCSIEQITSHPDQYVIAYQNGDLIKCRNLSSDVQFTNFEVPFSRCRPIKLQLHPTLDHLFAVLFEDSTIYIFSANQPQPLQTLYVAMCLDFQWLVMPNAAVLCAISNKEHLYLFDICDDQMERLLLKVYYEPATSIQKMTSVFHGFTQYLLLITDDVCLRRIELSQLNANGNVRQWMRRMEKMNE